MLSSPIAIPDLTAAPITPTYVDEPVLEGHVNSNPNHKLIFCSSLTPENNFPKRPFQTFHPLGLHPIASKIKLLCITLFTDAIITHRNPRDLTAAPITPTYVDEPILEDHVNSNTNHAEAIKILLDVKMSDRKFVEAFSLINRLITLEPLNLKWSLFKAKIQCYCRMTDLSKSSLEKILSKNPICFEVYHWFVRMSDEGEWEILVKRIERVITKCAKEDVRGFKLLIGQIRFMQGRYDEVMDVYDKLMEELPWDFRPYLYQGVIWVSFGNVKEAKKQFKKYRSLGPNTHDVEIYATFSRITKALTRLLEDERGDI